LSTHFSNPLNLSCRNWNCSHQHGFMVHVGTFPSMSSCGWVRRWRQADADAGKHVAAYTRKLALSFQIAYFLLTRSHASAPIPASPRHDHHHPRRHGKLEREGANDLSERMRERRVGERNRDNRKREETFSCGVWGSVHQTHRISHSYIRLVSGRSLENRKKRKTQKGT